MRIPIRSETDAFRSVLAVAAVVAVATLVYYQVAPLAALALFMVLIAGGLLARVTRAPRESSIHGAEAASDRGPKKRRVLLVTAATPTSAQIERLVRELRQRRGFAGEPELEIHAPVLASRTHFVTTDIDRETEDARRRLKDALAAARTAGIRASGEVGDPIDPVTGVEDELRRCHSDVIVFTASDDAKGGWIADKLVQRLDQEPDNPVTHLMVGSECRTTRAPHLSVGSDAQVSTPRLDARDRARDRIVVRAELNRIVRTLEMTGPLRRDVLSRACGARHWHTGGLSAALRAGIREGRVKELPFGFVAVAQTPRQARPTGARRRDAPEAHPRRRGDKTRSPRRCDSSISPHAPELNQPKAAAPHAAVGMPRHAGLLVDLPDGTREALPVALMLAAIAVPVGLLALSTLGAAALLLGLAIGAMALVTVALVVAVGRLTSEPGREEPDGMAGRRTERRRT
jgi:hypothetical protein